MAFDVFIFLNLKCVLSSQRIFDRFSICVNKVVMFLHVFISFHDFQGCLNVFQCFFCNAVQCVFICFMFSMFLNDF